MHWDSDDELFLETEEDSWPTERIEFRSVGIDIGSSTSHLMVSRLVLRRRGREFYSGYTVTEREVLYRSPILLTPYLNNNLTIDTERLAGFIAAAYREAGITPADIHTGAVITTGEAARKENAAAIIELFAAQAGRFVCATAGPNLEGVLAAHGSGAVRHSLRHAEGNRHPVVLNVDIGGGTAKLALVREGRVLETSAVNVGARLVAWDAKDRLTRVEEAGGLVAESLGIKARVGETLRQEEKEALARRLGDVLLDYIRRRPPDALGRQLAITPPLAYDGPVDVVSFSGGVSEYIYGHESTAYGDLGPLLGSYIRRQVEHLGLPLGLAEEGIRATVIGASQYTVQVSGNTIFLSDKQVLPLRNLPVIPLAVPRAGALDTPVLAAEIGRGFTALDLVEGEQPVAIAVDWRRDPAYADLAALCDGLLLGLPRTAAGGAPLVLVFNGDVANLVGRLLAESGRVRSPIIAVDSIDLRQLNYVDIGEELEESHTVPVTVKSLVFR